MRKGLIIFTSIFIYSFAVAQESSMELFFGNWTGHGQLFENNAEFKMVWKSSLNGKFIELEFENGLVNDGNYQKILSSKAVYWFIDETHLKGQWYDTRGYILPIEATFENNTLTTLWGDDKTERGKTVYQFDATTQTISVKDYVLSESDYRPFGEAQYSKVQ